VVVVGAGAEGLLSALALARAGTHVTVIDALDGPAQATSFANAGVIGVTDTVPLAAPASLQYAAGAALAGVARAPRRAWRALTGGSDDDDDAEGGGDRDLSAGVFSVSPRALADPHFIAFGARFVCAALDGGFSERHAFMNKLADAGVPALFRVAEQEGIRDGDFCAWRGGRLIFYRSPRSFEKAVAAAEAKAALPGSHNKALVLSATEAAEREPFLRHLMARGGGGGGVAGALVYEADAAADCYRFMRMVERRLAAMPNVTLRYGVRATGFAEESVGGSRTVRAVLTDAGELEADAVVVACGAVTPRLWRTVGRSLPVYPVKGYSITLPAAPGDPTKGRNAGAVDEQGVDLVPRGIVVDHDKKMYATRLGDRIRFVSGAEVSGADTSTPTWSVADAVLSVARSMAPAYFAAAGLRGSPVPQSARDLGRPVPLWLGMRPVSADGVPIISRARRHDNLYVATGHGAHGWKLSAITGLLVARLVLCEGEEAAAGEDGGDVDSSVDGDGRTSRASDALVAAAGGDEELAARVRAVDLSMLDLRRFEFANWVRARLRGHVGRDAAPHK